MTGRINVFEAFDRNRERVNARRAAHRTHGGRPAPLAPLDASDYVAELARVNPGALAWLRAAEQQAVDAGRATVDHAQLRCAVCGAFEVLDRGGRLVMEHSYVQHFLGAARPQPPEPHAAPRVRADDDLWGA